MDEQSLNLSSIRFGRAYRVLMGDFIAVIGIAVFFGVAITWRVREGLRDRQAVRDDGRRAGKSADATPQMAARRAEGTTAWTRLSGP